MRNYDFNEPLNGEPDGSFISVGQMQFFLNRKDGKKLFESGSDEFWEYYNLCRIYNLVSEIMEFEPDSAMMYWDSKKGIVSMSYPSRGIVAASIAEMEPSVIGFEDIDPDNNWASGLDE